MKSLRFCSLFSLIVVIAGGKLSAAGPQEALSYIIESEKTETTSDKSIKALDFISSAYDTDDFYQSGYTPVNSNSILGSRFEIGFQGNFYMQRGQEISSEFGYRKTFHRNHYGIDISMNVGDTVRTPLAGVVTKVAFDADGYGHYVTIRHGGGVETRYGHLAQPIVIEGQHLMAEQPVGLSGNSGNSTGPHLHFETRCMGMPVDPRLMFNFSYVRETHP